MSKLFSIISLLTALAVIITAFVGCGKKNPIDNPTPDNGNLAGGWTTNLTFENPSIPKDAQDALNRATENLTGASYEPVAYLGSQVVAGLNYAFLCKITPVTPDAKATLNVVTVYQDLSGNATINETKQVDITKYTTEQEVKFEMLSGGYNSDSASGTALTDDAKTAFDKALDGFDGIQYEPVALLGTQVVAGTNYAVLCKATSANANPQSALAVVVIYADLQSNASVRSICQFSIGE